MVAVTLTLLVADGTNGGVLLAEPVPVTEEDAVRVTEEDAVPLAVCVAVALMVAVMDAVCEGDAVRLAEAVPV